MILPYVLLAGILKKNMSIHQDIFQFSLRKIIPIPGFFKPIGYRQHAEALGELLDRLRALSDYPFDDESKDRLKAYVRLLTQVIAALQNVCSRFAEKIDGTTVYPHANYKADVADYVSLLRECLDCGERLVPASGQVSFRE